LFPTIKIFMRGKNEEKNLLKKILSSKLSLLASVVLLVLISVALGKVIYRRYLIEQEIGAMREEIEKAEGKNKELSDLIAYFSTDAFREKMARQKLNLQRPGETVVALPVKKEGEKIILGSEDDSSENRARSEDAENFLANAKKWWHYFFSNQ